MSGSKDDPVRRRPRWLAPALAGIAIGALAGALIPDPLPPCAPPEARVELVVDRFLTRLGSSAEAIQECWTPGHLSPLDLAAYLAAQPPSSYRLGTFNEGRGINGEVFMAVQVFPTWRGAPPDGWNADFRWIVLRRGERPTRWTIDETQPPFGP